MKAIILASLVTVLSFVMVTAIFRLARIERRARALVFIFAAGVATIISISLATTPDLSILPEGLVATPPWFDLASAVFFFAAAFFGGIMQLYNLADRGFSLRILIDLKERADHGGTTDSLWFGYGAGKGIGWMYQKRINDMLRQDLIRIDGRIVTVTASGNMTARTFHCLRHVFHFERD